MVAASPGVLGMQLVASRGIHPTNFSQTSVCFHSTSEGTLLSLARTDPPQLAPWDHDLEIRFVNHGNLTRYLDVVAPLLADKDNEFGLELVETAKLPAGAVIRNKAANFPQLEVGWAEQREGEGGVRSYSPPALGRWTRTMRAWRVCAAAPSTRCGVCART